MQPPDRESRARTGHATCNSSSQRTSHSTPPSSQRPPSNSARSGRRSWRRARAARELAHVDVYFGRVALARAAERRAAIDGRLVEAVFVRAVRLLEVLLPALEGANAEALEAGAALRLVEPARSHCTPRGARGVSIEPIDALNGRRYLLQCGVPNSMRIAFLIDGSQDHVRTLERPQCHPST